MIPKMQGVPTAESKGDLALLLIVWQGHMHGELVRKSIKDKYL